MSATEQTTRVAASTQHWIANQPYPLLSITALCWAGNAIVGRLRSLIILGVRLTAMQALGLLLSLCGVLTILLHVDFTTLSNIEFNKGDLIFMVALVIFALYSVLSLKRPAIHGLSFLAFTLGCARPASFRWRSGNCRRVPW
jgi:drug/metabolite transporter (DMT)-like permease